METAKLGQKGQFCPDSRQVGEWNRETKERMRYTQSNSNSDSNCYCYISSCKGTAGEFALIYPTIVPSGLHAKEGVKSSATKSGNVEYGIRVSKIIWKKSLTLIYFFDLIN